MLCTKAESLPQWPGFNSSLGLFLHVIPSLTAFPVSLQLSLSNKVIFTSVRTHVKVRTGCAALPKLVQFGFSWLVLAERVLHRSPEACLHQVWSSSLRTPPPPLAPLPPLSLSSCSPWPWPNATSTPITEEQSRHSSPLCQLTHFQRRITLFPHISLMPLLPFPLCSWKCSLPMYFLPFTTLTWHNADLAHKTFT